MRFHTRMTRKKMMQIEENQLTPLIQKEDDKRKNSVTTLESTGNLPNIGIFLSQSYHIMATRNHEGDGKHENILNANRFIQLQKTSRL
jgi:hypothetical protein